VTFEDVDDASSTEKFVLRALVISLLVHVLVFSLWRVGQAQGWWHNIVMPRWMQRISQVMLPVIPKKPALDTPSQSQLTFVEVDPALAKPEPPKKPMFQGAQNTVAANREIKVESAMPDIEGKQEKFLKTIEDAKPKAPSPPATPSPPQTIPAPRQITPSPPETAPAKTAPRQTYTPGDLAMLRPSDQSKEGKGDAATTEQEQPQPKPEYQRPRTLAEAQAKSGVYGPQTHIVGGVRTVTPDVSLDVQGTPLGDYIALMVETVRAHWYQLLETQTADVNGKVILRFRLHPDGRVSDMTVLKNEVSDLLQMTCERAVLDPKFKKWTREMRLDLPNDYYDMTFSFYYEP
jgi:hypothetical protein